MKLTGFPARFESFFSLGRSKGSTVVIFLAVLAAGCGLPVGTSVSNDQVPSTATYLTGGALIGTGVSGTAQVYIVGSTILLHLEGLVTPTGTSYGVFLENGSPSTPFFLSTLVAQTGNQNYFTGKAPPITHFSRVALRATSATNSMEMAAATLATY